MNILFERILKSHIKSALVFLFLIFGLYYSSVDNSFQYDDKPLSLALKTEFFRSKTLLFGFSASVVGFCRLARALRELAVRALRLAVVSYFDDFPHLEVEELWDSGWKSFVEMFNVLGWELSLEPHKDKPFDRLFGAPLADANVIGGHC